MLNFDAYLLQSFRTQAPIRTQTQMIHTQATGCLVPILSAVEIRFHQPKQLRLTVSLVWWWNNDFRGEEIASIELHTSAVMPSFP